LTTVVLRESRGAGEHRAGKNKSAATAAAIQKSHQGAPYQFGVKAQTAGKGFYSRPHSPVNEFRSNLNSLELFQERRRDLPPYAMDQAQRDGFAVVRTTSRLAIFTTALRYSRAFLAAAVSM
jgi:hypothetical protein